MERWKITTRVSSFVLCILLVASTLKAATKVYLLGGQSNMAGVGGYATDQPCPPPYNQVQTAVKFWNYGPNSVGSNGVNQPKIGNGWINLQPGFGYRSSEFGPELSFGSKLSQLNPSDEIYIVKLGLSSTNLAVDWNPNGTGASYNLFKSRVNAALVNLTADGKSPTIAAMLWMQGESDAVNHAFASAYQTNTMHLIERVRDDFASPDMRFILGRITTYYGSPGDNALVRNAQDAIPSSAGNAASFSTGDLQWAYAGHYGTQGQIELGLRFASYAVAGDAVPEPASWLNVSIGALLLGRWRLGRGWRRSYFTDLQFPRYQSQSAVADRDNNMFRNFIGILTVATEIVRRSTKSSMTTLTTPYQLPPMNIHIMLLTQMATMLLAARLEAADEQRIQPQVINATR